VPARWPHLLRRSSQESRDWSSAPRRLSACVSRAALAMMGTAVLRTPEHGDMPLPLVQAMIGSGHWHAHARRVSPRVVPGGSYGGNPDLTLARAILQRNGIDLNSYENGVWLPGPQFDDPLPQAYHQPVHTTRYFANLNRLLSTAQNRQDAVRILNEIAERLARNDKTLY
jgi:hypothetical protein